MMLFLRSLNCYGKVTISSQFKLKPGCYVGVMEIKAALQNSQDLLGFFFPSNSFTFEQMVWFGFCFSFGEERGPVRHLVLAEY